MSSIYEYFRDCPYKGEMSYSERDKLFFFGRDQDQENIIKKLFTWRLTILYGTSGVGKSSVLRASVAQYLNQAALKHATLKDKPGLAVIVFPPIEGNLAKECSWQDPLNGIKKQLKQTLIDLGVNPPSLEDDSGLSFIDILEKCGESIRDREGQSRLVIMLDQFEDFFIHLLEEEKKISFANELVKAINYNNYQNLNVNFLFSIREDSLAKIGSYFQTYIPNVLKNLQDLKPITKESASQAIQKPIAEYNRQYIILDSLLHKHLTVIYGDSRVQKSTLLNSGIVNYLRQAAINNLEKTGNKPNLAVVVFNNWHKDKNLLSALQEKIQTEINNLGVMVSLEPTLSFLETLDKWTEIITENHEKGEIFIILDQFEQYFLNQGLEKDAQQLIQEIEKSNDNIHWLISLKERRINEFKNFLNSISSKSISSKSISNKSYLHLFQDVQKSNLIEEIEGEQVLGKQNFQIEPALVDEILKDITKEDKTQIETFLLQIVMDSLWEKDVKNHPNGIIKKQTFIDLERAEGISKAYLFRKLGDPSKIQENRATDADDKQKILTDEQQKIAACIFPHLVTSGSYKRQQTVSRLLELANGELIFSDFVLQEKQIHDLLKELSESGVRIIRPLPDNVYEIFHDVLAKPILEWQSLFVREHNKKQFIEDETKKTIKTLMEQYGKEALVNNLTRESIALREKEPVRQDELMALLARQAYLFNQQYDAGMLDNVDEALRQAMTDSHFSPILCGHEDEVTSVTFSPDSKLFASGSFDGTVKLWSLEQRQCINTISTGLKPRGVLSIAISPDGEKLAVGCGDNDYTLRVFDLKQPTPDPIILKGHTNEIWSVAFNPHNSKLLASGSWDKTVRLWDLTQPPEKAEISRKYHRDYIWSVAFSQDGKTLAAGCRNGTIWLRSLNDSNKLKLTQILSVHQGDSNEFKKHYLFDDQEIFSVAFNADGTRLASGSGDGKVRLWHLTEPNKPPTIMPESENLARSVVAFSQDGQWLVSGSDNGKMLLWKLNYPTSNPILVKSLDAHYKGISSVAFSPDGKCLGSSSWDWKARLWDLQPSETEPIVLQQHQAQITIIAFSPDSKKLASGSYDRSLLLWDLNNPNSPPKLLNNDDGNVNSVVFSRDGTKIASGSDDGHIRLWNPDQPHRPLIILPGHEQSISALAFSPHHPNMLVSGSWDNTVKIWDLSNSQDPKILNTLKKHGGRISSVAFSPNDNILATSSDDRTVRLWNLNQPDTPSIALPAFDHAITSLAFNKTIKLDTYGDVQLLAISTDDQKIQVWDINPFQKDPQAEPIFLSEYSSSEDKGDPTQIKGTPVIFSPDGYTLASGSKDHHVLLLDLRQPDVKPVELEGLRDKITTLAFSPDGKWIAAGSLDKTIRLWLAKTDMIADLVCQKVWRNLTLDEWQKYVSEDIPYQCTCPNLPQGESVLASQRSDVLEREFKHKLHQLMPKQKRLLELIAAKNQDLSEEDIAKQLQKIQLEDADFIGLESLCRLGFLSKKSRQWGTITSYSLSDRYRQYHQN